MSIYCTNCGSKVADGTKFCDKCGSPISGGSNYKVDYDETGVDKKIIYVILTIIASILYFCPILDSDGLIDGSYSSVTKFFKNINGLYALMGESSSTVSGLQFGLFLFRLGIIALIAGAVIQYIREEKVRLIKYIGSASLAISLLWFPISFNDEELSVGEVLKEVTIVWWLLWIVVVAVFVVTYREQRVPLYCKKQDEELYSGWICGCGASNDLAVNFCTRCGSARYETKISVTGIAVNPTHIELSISDSKVVKATVYPNDAKNKDIVWTSANTSVATVNNQGIVHGVNEGSTMLVATTVDGGYKAECNVIVTAKKCQSEFEIAGNLD